MLKPGIDADRIDPEFLISLADPLERVYEAIELDLMKNIARHFRGGMKIPKSKVKSADAWRAYQLAQIGGVTRENIEIIASYAGDVSELTQMALRQSIETAISVVEPELAKAVSQPSYIPQRSETAQRVLETYQAQALNRYNLVNTVMLNSSLQKYREVTDNTWKYEQKLRRAQETLNAETGAVIFGSESWTQALSKAVRDMAADGLTGFRDAGGHEWSPQAYVMMDIRTTAANTARQAVFQRNEAYGNSLISVSQHPGARPLCAPWQGGVYSTNGWTGDIVDGNGQVLHVIPLAQTSYGQPAGLFGINCGHMSFPFIAGVSVLRPRIPDDEENRELYKHTQEQRYMERKIRKLKTEADVLEAAGDLEGAKQLRRDARSATANLREWCDTQGMPYYPDRVRVIRPVEVKAILNSPGDVGEKAIPYSQRGIDIGDRLQGYIKDMPTAGKYITGEKGTFSMRDLAVLTAETGVEYTLIDISGKSVLLRGDELSTVIPDAIFNRMKAEHGTLECHSHPFIGDLAPSSADKDLLEKLKWQEYSAIIDPTESAVKYSKDGVIGHFEIEAQRAEDYYADIFAEEGD